jgi:hypothetical protein
VAADISRPGTSILPVMMIPAIFGWAYMPIIAADISLLLAASSLAMTGVIFGRASLPTVSAGLPISR